jgi:DNA-binding MarR family transcriptional regulator
VLYVVERADFTYLLNHTELTRGNLSSHLSRLEDASYIEVKKEFVDKIPRTLLSLTDRGRKAFDDYRKNIMGVLSGLGT